MDMDYLEHEYHIAKGTTSYTQHQKFIKQLLFSNESSIIAYHFGLLKRRENWDLYQSVRYAFLKRGLVAERFLIDRIKHENDPELQADALQLLGGLRSKEALPLARDFVTHPDSDHRYRGCFVLGWVGTAEDIDLLGKLIFNDSHPLVRGTAATAQRQIWYRLPETKPKLLAYLQHALKSEEDQEVLSAIIITLQTLLKKNLGLRENSEERKITGNVDGAKKKALEVLESIDS